MKQALKRALLSYLRLNAKLQLKKTNPDIIGITGTAGKTSTLYATGTVLKSKYKVKISTKANSEWGLPVNILGFKPYRFSSPTIDWLQIALRAPLKLAFYWPKYQKYVAEMGVDSPYPPQNMNYLLTLLKPTTGVFLNVEPMHSQPFDHLVDEIDPHKRRQAIREVIAAEKGKLIESLPPTGTAILNSDDDLVIGFSKKTKAKVVTFGHKNPADVKVETIKQSLAGTKIGFEYQGQKADLNLRHYLLPDHYALSFAAAIAVGASHGINLKSALKNLEKNFDLPPGRSSLFKGVKGSVILDSSYNASAKPTIDSLNLLARLNAGRTYAILGDMRELGLESQTEHERVIESAAQTCTGLYLIGPEMKQYALPKLHQLNYNTVSWFETGIEAAADLKTRLRPGDMVLVKGSQNTLFLETAVEALLSNPKRDRKKLCRRGKFWNKKRRAVLKEGAARIATGINPVGQ